MEETAMKKPLCIITVLLLLCIAVSAYSQDIEDNVSRYTSVNGSKYLQPLADAFGANLNSGFFCSAKIPTFGLHLEFGIKAMYAPIPAEKKTFSPEPEFGWNPDPGTLLPTIFGDEEPVVIAGIEFPGGAWDTDFFPLAVPQLTIGSVLGTDFTVRYITYSIDDDIGDIKLFGWGLRHSLSQYMPLMFLDISAAFYHQSFSVGDIIDASAVFAGIQASYSLSLLTLYGSVGYEKSTLGISYEYDEPGEEPFIVDFDLTGENNFRTTLGLALDLYILKIHADYNFAPQKTIAGGVSFGF